MSGSILIPDGKFVWSGTDWVPNHPETPPIIPHTTQYNPTSPNVPQQPDTISYVPAPPNVVIPTQTTSKVTTPFIVIGVALIVVMAGIGAYFLFKPTIQEDDVVLTYFVFHTCDNILITYVDGFGQIQQDNDYYESAFYIQFSGKMKPGDEMIGIISGSSWDDDLCAASLQYTVKINDGDITQLHEEIGVMEKYEDVELTYIYRHGQEI